MLDSDLAAIYGVTTKRLNERLRRNPNRFPSDFAFQLTRQEFTNLRSQIATSSLRSRSATSKHGGRRYLPWVFTEHGAIMLASVLDSDVAIDASVRVVRAFVRLREIISANAELAAKFAQLEQRLESHDEAIAQLFAAIRQLLAPAPEKKREIGFHVRERQARYRAKGRS
ncbi:MAG: ORF6N domain-containing protein [Chthoniobacterales bacterium]